jgi:hypothetical protein
MSSEEKAAISAPFMRCSKSRTACLMVVKEASEITFTVKPKLVRAFPKSLASLIGFCPNLFPC